MILVGVRESEAAWQRESEGATRREVGERGRGERVAHQKGMDLDFLVLESLANFKELFTAWQSKRKKPKPKGKKRVNK